jgi:hypothetical protein
MNCCLLDVTSTIAQMACRSACLSGLGRIDRASNSAREWFGLCKRFLTANTWTGMKSVRLSPPRNRGLRTSPRSCGPMSSIISGKPPQKKVTETRDMGSADVGIHPRTSTGALSDRCLQSSFLWRLVLKVQTFATVHALPDTCYMRFGRVHSRVCFQRSQSRLTST